MTVNPSPQPRLSKADRRAQLLETAAAVLRAEGADALSLPRLAERAGVTRPVVYDHFGDRPALLVALYRRHDEAQAERVKQVLARRAATLPQVVDLLAEAYVDCALASGPELGALSAALAACEETAGFKREARATYVAQFGAAVAPHIRLSTAEADAVLLGAVAAADALAEEAAAGRMSRVACVAAVSRIMLGALAA